ncbi:hypothetical protein Taro_000303, partial [Colocasia esculenta]|nr:hypothetical protein [Colocasia esculenta]
VVFLLVMASRGEMSLGMRIRVSNRPQHPRVLPTLRLHSRLSWRLRLRSEPTCGGPRCYVLGSRMVLWRLVAFDHRTLEQALSAACRQEGEMEQYLEEKKASQKRPAAPFQRQEKKKATFQSPLRPVASGSGQVPSQRSPNGSPMWTSPSSSSSSASDRTTRETSSPSSSVCVSS